MIKSFRHKGLEQFFRTGSKAGIQPAHASKLRLQLTVLNDAQSPRDLPAAWRPHPLMGSANDLGGHFAIWVTGNWRLTFRFDGSDVHLIDYTDYH